MVKHEQNWYVTGGCPRDDGIAEEYGSMCYLYNDVEVIVSAPMSMKLNSGFAIYTCMVLLLEYI